MTPARKANEIDIEVNRIRNAVIGGEISAAELARRSGVPKTTLVGIKEAAWNPRATTLSKLIDGLTLARAEKAAKPQPAKKSK